MRNGGLIVNATTKRMYVALLLVLTMGMVTGQVAAAEVVEFWHQFGSGAAREAIDVMVEKFNASQDQYEVVAIVQADFQEKLALALATGVGPDVAYGVSVPQYQPLGLIMDLKPYMDRDGVHVDDFFPAAIEGQMVGDGVYALPVFLTLDPVLFYRVDRLQEAGLSTEAPATWEDLRAMERLLTRRGSENQLTSMGFNWGPGGGSYTYPLYYKLAGGQMVDESGRNVLFGGDLGLAVLEWLADSRSWYGASDISQFYAELGTGSNADAFALGGLAIVSRGNWWGVTYQGLGMRPEADFGAWVMPAWEDEKYVGVSARRMSIPTYASNPDGAWEFLKWITSEEPAAEWALMRGIIPGNRHSAQDPRFAEEIPFWFEYIDMTARYGLASRADMDIPDRIYQEMDNAYNVVMNRLNSPRAALESASFLSQAILNDYWRDREAN